MAKTRSLAQSRGGKVGKNPKDRILADLPPILLVHSRDVAVLIAETINHVRAGVMDTKVANCVGILSNCLLKALEQSDIEERLTSVEKIVLERRTMT